MSGPNPKVINNESGNGGASMPGAAGASADVVYIRLLDFVVSQALQINSRCLAVVAQPTSPSSLQLTELRWGITALMSAWQLVRKRIGKSQFRSAAARIEEMFALLPAEASFGRVAQDLLDRASSSRSRAALRQVMDEWSSLHTAAAVPRKLPLEALSRLLQLESEAWRLAFSARGYPTRALIADGFGRTYKRAKRLSKRNLKRQQIQPLSAVKLRRWRRRVVQLVGQLELLGDNLSDTNKRALWYLRRLERNLQRQGDLLLFVEQVRHSEATHSAISKKAYQRALEAAAERQGVLQRRSSKLMRNGFRLSSAAYCRSIAKDSAKIRHVVATQLPGTAL